MKIKFFLISGLDCSLYGLMAFNQFFRPCEAFHCWYHSNLVKFGAILTWNNCNKVTQKRNKLAQRQSPFLRLCRRFFRLSILNLNVPALPFWQKNAAQSQQKKELYAAAQLDMRQKTVPGTEHFRTIFSAAHRALLGRLRHQYQFL